MPGTYWSEDRSASDADRQRRQGSLAQLLVGSIQSRLGSGPGQASVTAPQRRNNREFQQALEMRLSKSCLCHRPALPKHLILLLRPAPTHDSGLPRPVLPRSAQGATGPSPAGDHCAAPAASPAGDHCAAQAAQ
jgi:hypothetical protein